MGRAAPADGVGVELSDAGGEEGGPVLCVAVGRWDDQARLVVESVVDEVEQRVDEGGADRVEVAVSGGGAGGDGNRLSETKGVSV